MSKYRKQGGYHGLKTRQRAAFPDVHRRWLAGESTAEIASALDRTVGSVSMTIHRMRDQGWDLPYRRRVA
jgi:hypothetical protein